MAHCRWSVCRGYEWRMAIETVEILPAGKTLAQFASARQ